MPRLMWRSGDEAGEALDLRIGRYRIGRAADCDLVLAEEGVSRGHAVVECDGKRCTVADDGSQNGTFVNGERIDHAELRHGDRIRFGPNAELEFLAGGDRAFAQGSAPTARRPRRSWGKMFRTSRFWLTPSDGEDAICLTRSVTTVGRDAGNGMVLDDESISRFHARLDHQGDRLVVTDLDSSNGTTVNGARVARAVLDAGSIVEFGALRFEVTERHALATSRVAMALAFPTLVVATVWIVAMVAGPSNGRDADSPESRRARALASLGVERGLAAFRRNDFDDARGHLLYAGDLLLLSGLAPAGATLERPADVFRVIEGELSPAARDFDYATALDPGMADSRARLDVLSDRQYVEHQVRRIAIELGQHEDVPAGFMEQVWHQVQERVGRRDAFQATLERSSLIHPRIRQIMADSHLPEVFCFVAWAESDLEPGAQGEMGARGLWQLTESTAGQYGLRVDLGQGIDERTDVVKSTRAAARYIAYLIRTFGYDQFMCALAAYPRGEGRMRVAMEKIPDPQMEPSKKYWYLLEHRLLPPESSDYVPRVFAASILAGAPERFGYRRP